MSVSSIDDLMQFMEETCDFLPAQYMENVTVVETANDTLLCVDGLEWCQEVGLEPLSQSLLTLLHGEESNQEQGSGVESRDTSVTLLTGSKRIHSLSQTALLPTDAEKIDDHSISQPNPNENNYKRQRLIGEAEEVSKTFGLMTNEWRLENFPSVVQTSSPDTRILTSLEQKEQPQYNIPKSILKTRATTRTSRVVFHDTVTLVKQTYDYVDGYGYQLNQVSENINRLSYECRETPLQSCSILSEANCKEDNNVFENSFHEDVDQNSHEQLEAMNPYQFPSYVSLGNSTGPETNVQSSITTDYATDAVKKILFPPQEELHSVEIMETRIVSEVSLQVCSKRLSMDEIIKVCPDNNITEATCVIDNSSVSEESNSAAQTDKSFISSDTVVSTSSVIPSMVLYSQDLLLESSPRDPISSNSYHIPLSSNSTTSLSVYQTLSPPLSQDMSIHRSIPIGSSNKEEASNEPVSPASINIDPLRLTSWPSVIWSRTKSHLPLPELICTDEPGVILYLVQQNTRFEDNLALQAAMVASQSLQLPLVVLALLEQEILEDAEELLQLYNHQSSPIHPITPTTFESKYVERNGDKYDYNPLTSEKRAIIQQSFVRLHALRYLEKRLSENHIPMLVYEYPSEMTIDSEIRQCASFSHTPRSLALHLLLHSSNSANTDCQFPRHNVSVFITDDFVHPYTRQLVASLISTEMKLPIFCIDSSSVLCPNLQFPLLDDSDPKHDKLSDWAWSSETYNDFLLQEQCDYQQRVFESQRQPHRDLFDMFLELNEWNLVADNHIKQFPWSMSAQIRLQKDKLLRSEIGDVLLFLVPKHNSVRRHTHWVDLIDRIVTAAERPADITIPMTTSRGLNIVTPATSRIALSQPALVTQNQNGLSVSPLHILYFNEGMVLKQWQNLQDAFHLCQLPPSLMNNNESAKQDFVSFFVASYQMRLFSPQNILSLNYLLSSTLKAPQELKLLSKHIIEQCMHFDYAQLVIYDSRKLRCACDESSQVAKFASRSVKADPMMVSSPSISWMNVLPLETLTFLFHESNSSNFKGNSLLICLPQLRYMWRKQEVLGSISPTSAINGVAATESTITSVRLLNIQQNYPTCSINSSHQVKYDKQLQLWLLAYLLQAPTISLGVNIAFRTFALHASIASAENSLIPAVFLLALMKLPINVNLMLQAEPLLSVEGGAKQFVDQHVGDRVGINMKEEFWKMLHSTFSEISQ